MPLKRTPPRASATEESTHTLTHCMSDSNLNKPVASLNLPDLSSELATSEPNIATRKRTKKRQPDDWISEEKVMTMFQQLRKEQDEKFNALMNKVQSGIDAHTEQYTHITTSIDFLAQKYDEAISRIRVLEQEKASDRKYIQALEVKVEHIERSLLSSSIEVRNVPKKDSETKEDLLHIVQSIGTALNTPLASTEVQDVYRINTKNGNSHPIVARLSTVVLRDKIISSVKTYNKKYSTNKFSTSNLKLAGPQKPIFVSEFLTMQTKKLFFNAREFAKGNDYKYCWATRGRIYLRKADGAALIRINDENDIENLNK